MLLDAASLLLSSLLQVCPSQLFTSLQQRLQEVLQAVGEAAHHVAGVAVLGQEEGQLQVWVLLQLHLPAVAPGQLVRRVLSHGHHMIDQLLHTHTHR